MALTHHLGAAPQAIRDRVTAETRARGLSSWHKAALAITAAASARKLLARIRAAAPLAPRAA